MSLEEKIALLDPKLRDQVEDYVDYLISRSNTLDSSDEFSPAKESDEDEKGQEAVPVTNHASSSHNLPYSSRGDRVRSCGIILAEERPIEQNPDYVDFADINSRFGHTPHNSNDEKGPGRLKRLLDWL